LFAPILAQLLTLGLGARTEGRYVATEIDDRLEAGASAGIGLAFSMPHVSVGVGYSPYVTVTPLDSEPREWLLADAGYGNVTLDYGFRFRRSTLTFAQTAGYTVENPYRESLANPTVIPPPDAAPGVPDNGVGALPGSDTVQNPAESARRAVDYRVQRWFSHSSVTFTHPLSRQATLGANAGYSLGAGIGRARADNPLVQGPDAGVNLGYRISARDQLTTDLDAQYAWSESHTPIGSTEPIRYRGFVTTLMENWGHLFSRRTRADLGIGVSYASTQVNDGPVEESLYPAGLAGITHDTRIARGMLSLFARATTAPVLDATTGSADPRIGLAFGASWVRRKLSLNANLSSALSLSDDDSAGALNSFSADAGAAYELGAGFSADTGVRGDWQTVGALTVIPPSAAFYVGISWAGGVPLLGASPATKTASPATRTAPAGMK
jgi:hypothetical protein